MKQYDTATGAYVPESEIFSVYRGGLSKMVVSTILPENRLIVSNMHHVLLFLTCQNAISIGSQLITAIP